MKSKYTSIFTSIAVKCVTDKEKDELLALASLEQLRKFIPEAASANDGFLPIAFNAFTPNRINKNDDVIDTKTALAIYKKFINTPINIEHKRGNVVGFILSAGFSEFGTDKILTEEEIKDYKKPFNVTLGGVIWKVVNSELADLIQDSNDPTSANYQTISASWELGFSGYNLLLLDKGQKNTENGKIIADGAEIEKYKEKLKALGGEGILEEQRLYRMPSEEVEPLGIGLTEKPAGDVKGIATELPEKDKKTQATIEELEKTNKELSKSSEDLQNKISQLEKPHVMPNTNMKINSIADITDENLKECKASTISEFISNHVTEKSKEWEKQKGELNTKVVDTEAIAKKAKEDLDKVNVDLKKVQDALAGLEQEKKDRDAVDKFNERMGVIAETYELDDEVRAAILDEVKALDTDEAFAKWQKKAEAIFKPFKKGAKKDDKDKEKGKDAKDKEDAKATLEDALDKGEKDKAKITNSSDAGDKSMKSKFAAAFARDQFVVVK